MANFVTPTADGGFAVETRNGSSAAVGYGYGEDGEVDYFGDDSEMVDGGDYDRYADEPEAYSPEDRITSRLNQTPLTDANSTEQQVVNWLLEGGEISQAQMQQIVEGFDRNNVPDDQRDLTIELLCLKEGSLQWEDLSDAAKELIAPYLAGNDASFNEATDDEASENTAELEGLAEELGIEQQLDRMDEQEQLGTKAIALDVLGVAADESLAAEHAQWAEEAHANGDYAMAIVSQLSAMFHGGQLTARQAMTQAVTKLGLGTALDAYTRRQYGYSVVGNKTQYGRNTQNTFDS